MIIFKNLKKEYDTKVYKKFMTQKIKIKIYQKLGLSKILSFSNKELIS